MNRTTVLTALLALTALAMAGAPWADPAYDPNVRRATAVEAWGLPDGETGLVGRSRVVSTGEVDHTQLGAGPGGQVPQTDRPGLTPFFDWGNDVMVDELNDLPSSGKVSADVAPNGDIYVGVLDPDAGAGNDTIFFYRSTNGGQNWSYLNFIGGASGDINDFVLRVGSDANGVWWYAFVLYDLDAGLYVRRQRADLTGVGWSQIMGGDSLANVSADRNIENPQHLFCTWSTNSGYIRMRSSSDSSVTWGNNRNVMTNSRLPAVCAGGDGYVYIAVLMNNDSATHRVGRYTNNLISPSFVFSNCDSNADRRFEHLSIAAARTAPGASQTAVIFTTYRHNPNGNHGPRYSYTTNGGTSWNSNFWPPTNQSRPTWLARYPYVRVGYGETGIFRAVVTMPETTTSFDTVSYAFSRSSSPTTWESYGTFNDQSATGEYGAQVDMSSQTSGGFIVYREFGQRRIWFDGWDFTGVAELPGSARPSDRVVMPLGGREVRLSLGSPARVRAAVVDAAGRTVSVIHDGQLSAGDHRFSVPSLSRGVYFVNVDVAGARHQGKLIVTD